MPPPSLVEASYGGQCPQVDRGGEIQFMHYVYILKCSNETEYVGCTNDLNDRLDRHNKGQVEATKKRLPINLLCYTAFQNKYTAYSFEKYLKSGSGRAFMKKHLI